MAEEKKTGFAQWLEYRWTAPDLDWRAGKVLSCGIDVGSVSTQAVIMVDGQLYAYANMRTGSDSRDSAEKALTWAIEGTGLSQSDLHYIVGTGYGRVNVPMAKRAITEIACHALGANFIYGPSVRTILDVGGQDIKVIRCDDKGKVLNFLMNDKCAAGTGRGMEVVAELLTIPVMEIGARSLQVEVEPKPVSTTCVVFAKSEMVGLLQRKLPVEEVLASYCLAMADRMAELVRKLGVQKEFVMTGGQSKNIGIVRRLERILNVEILKPKDKDPQIAGGIGAALFAKSLYERASKEKSA